MRKQHFKRAFLCYKEQQQIIVLFTEIVSRFRDLTNNYKLISSLLTQENRRSAYFKTFNVLET